MPLQSFQRPGCGEAFLVQDGTLTPNALKDVPVHCTSSERKAARLRDEDTGTESSRGSSTASLHTSQCPMEPHGPSLPGLGNFARGSSFGGFRVHCAGGRRLEEGSGIVA